MARYLLAGLMLCAAAAQAQRMYVTDELVITLRTGPSTQNTVIANLRTGDGLEVLEVDQDAGQARSTPGRGDRGRAVGSLRNRGRRGRERKPGGVEEACRPNHERFGRSLQDSIVEDAVRWQAMQTSPRTISSPT